MTVASTARLLERYPDILTREQGPLHLGPASIDFHLKAGTYYTLEPDPHSGCVELRNALFEERSFNQTLHLDPGTLYIVETQEMINTPLDICAQVASRSTYGRLGLQVCGNAGFIDPGFKGSVTLELFTVSRPLALSAGERIGQFIFWNVDSLTESYAGKYQGQRGATVARLDSSVVL